MNQLTLDLQPVQEYRTIPLTQGQVAMVDAEDYDRINQWKWSAHWDPKGGYYYAVRGYWLNGKIIRVIMAREIMHCPKGMEVDHINHDTLDNRRSTNLRIATHAENCRNRGLHGRNTSGYKGVHWNKEQRRWRARIMFDGKRKLLGDFKTLEEARAAYAAAAMQYHGKFARP